MTIVLLIDVLEQLPLVFENTGDVFCLLQGVFVLKTALLVLDVLCFQTENSGAMQSVIIILYLVSVSVLA